MVDKNFTAAYIKDIEQSLRDWLPSCETNVSCNLNESVRYSVLAGGKRIRAMLCLIVAKALKCPKKAALRVGCAIELIHAYSLIHDDLPAMDNDDFRRGKPSNHKAFGEATAILAGDSLLTMAFSWLADLPEYAVDSEKSIKIIKAIAQAAGHKGMIGGQMLDIHHETVKADMTQLERIHRQKTGALLSVPVECAAILADAGDDDKRNLLLFSHKIGLLFQIVDDILDVEGDFAQLGKTLGKDEKSGKSTYVSLLGIEQAKQFAQQVYEDALTALSVLSFQTDELRGLTDLIYNRNS